MSKPPFIQGQSAFHSGEPITANPHDNTPASGDDYPGAWANWRAGWMNARATKQHTERNAT